jgi:hypothetical protein
VAVANLTLPPKADAVPAFCMQAQGAHGNSFALSGMSRRGAQRQGGNRQHCG